MTMRGSISVLLLAGGFAALGFDSMPARAQATSEFAPLPTRPAKPLPPKAKAKEPAAPAKAEVPAPEPKPAVASAPEPPNTQPSPAAAASAPKESPASTANVAPAPAEKPEPPAAPPPAAAEKKMQEKELAKEKAKEHTKELVREKDEKKKKAAEKKEREREQAEKMAKEPPAPKPEKVDWKFASKLPPDDNGPRAIEFISKCLDNYDKCIAYVNERAEKIPAGDICLQSASDQQEVTEKVRKFITLRPAIHSQAANRVVTEALYVIYPCKRAAPERTAGKKK